MTYSTRWSALAVVLVLAGCDNSAPPVAPAAPDTRGLGALAARAIALAMAEAPVRRSILNDLRDSPFSEHKIVLQDYLTTASGKELLAAMERAGIDAEVIRTGLQSAPRIQFYAPVTAQRVAWRGTPDILVVPNLGAEPPDIGFTPTGTRALDIARGLPSDLVAVFVLQVAEPMFRRWAGPTAATETIQLPDESQVGSGRVVRDAAGTAIANIDDTPEGASGVQRSVQAAQAPGTYLTTLANYGVCDNQCIGEHLEFEFRSTASDNPNLYTSALLTGISPGSEINPSVWNGWWQVHTSRVINGVTMTVQVWETDGWPDPDDRFVCQANYPGCHFEVTTWPYLIQGSSWSFPLCEDQIITCDADDLDVGVSFADRETSVVTSVTVSPTTAWVVVGGAVASLTATARDQYGDVMGGQTATWSSSDAAVATVTPKGNMTANVSGVSGGQATITATIAGQNGTSTVDVYWPPPSVEITGPSQIQHQQSVQYFANAWGGTPPYHYQWRTRNCSNGVCGGWTPWTPIGGPNDRSDYWIGTPSCSVTRIDIAVLVTDAHQSTGTFWRDILVSGGTCF